MVNHKSEKWKKLWQREAVEEQAKLRQKIHDLRPEARRQAANWPQLTWDKVREVRKEFPAKTAVGVDGWSPKQLAQLPEGAGQALTMHLIALERSAVIPAAQAEAWIVLLDKPDGGDRPIALLPFLYRVLLRCWRREVDTWNAATASEWM